MSGTQPQYGDQPTVMVNDSFISTANKTNHPDTQAIWSDTELENCLKTMSVWFEDDTC